MSNKRAEKKVIAIVAAGGKGQRLGRAIPKTFILIRNRPILFFTLASLTRHPLINKIILVTNSDTLGAAKRLVKRARFNKVERIVIGGPTRKDSVRNGLKFIDSNREIFVLIHDAVRPFINKFLISKVINEAFRFNASICAVPVKGTIKSAKRFKKTLFVRQTLDRNRLWEVHTPGVFRADLLKKAFSRFGYLNVTDDATLLEKLGVRVRIVLSSYSNIKITTSEDLVFAKAIARQFNHSI